MSTGTMRLPLAKHAALQSEAGADVPVEVDLAGVEIIVHVLRAQTDFGQLPTIGIGRVDAVVEDRETAVATVVVAVTLDVVLVHDDRGLHRVLVPGARDAQLAGHGEIITETVLAVQADLLELAAHRCGSRRS
ncbi:hypothetical protein G6F32_015305 [Rhizopus arrhizus]|nr:hypothetical protein G6F32_015305 [Rhizopus arrhizus]